MREKKCICFVVYSGAFTKSKETNLMRSTDNNFIKRLKRQKEDALEYAVDKYLPLVKGITYKVLSPLENPGLVEECINDVFLTIWHHTNQFEGDTDDFRKWLCAVTKFKAIDTYRIANRRVEVEIVGRNDLEVASSPSIEDEVLVSENKNELLKLLCGFEVIDRDIFMMKFFLDMTSEEIATKIGLTKAAVDNRVYRGKKRLQQQRTSSNLGGTFA